jgi:hypothetical protein
MNHPPNALAQAEGPNFSPIVRQPAAHLWVKYGRRAAHSEIMTYICIDFR